VVIGCGFCWILGASFYFYMPFAGMTNPPMEWGYPRTVEGFIHAFTRGQYEKTNPSDIIGHPMTFITQLGMLVTGIVEEFNWVYMFLALVPFVFFRKMHRRERAWLVGITAIYLCLGVLLLILLNPPPDRQAQNLVRVFFTASHTVIAMLVGYGLTLIAAYMATHFAVFRRWGYWAGACALMLALYSLSQAAEPFIQGDIAGITHLFGVLAVAAVAGTLGAVIAAALLENNYLEEAKTANLIGAGCAVFAFILTEMVLFSLKIQMGSLQGSGLLVSGIGQVFLKDHYGLPIFGGLILVGMVLVFLVALFLYRNRAPLAITLAMFAIMPLHSIMTHWSDNEQSDHWFGYWFGHDMFTPPFKGADNKPLYPEMTKDAILFGGTDPGRFCPTYMIFCDSFIPHKCQPVEDQKFDRRVVYIITQNALADGTYLNYIRAQYNRSMQKDPPFFQELLRSSDEREKNYETNAIARMAIPFDRYFTALGARIEKRRRTYTSWFDDTQFTDFKGFEAKVKGQQDAVSKFIYQNLKPATQQVITGGNADKSAMKSVSDDLNTLINRELATKAQRDEKQSEKDQLEAEGSTSEKSLQRRQQLEKEINDLAKVEPLYTPDRFKEVQISDYLADFIKENPQSDTRVRLNRLLLEAAYPKQITNSIGGVYPDREIYEPTPDDSQKCFQEYLQDAQKRLQANQLKPGEEVHVVDNRVQVSGQVAVMAINGLLTKVIFDHNPKNEFFVEESFPLDWMYPHLSPFGVIMKINRQPLPELSEEIVKRDHEFWKQYSKRLTGDIIDYKTPIKDIAAFIEKVYLRRDFTGFTGDRRFVRDDSAQKAFSKLRSSIGGIYAWRITDPANRNPVAQRRMIEEAEFAFKQAFAFCPYSPEAVFRYVNLLLSLQRFDDALTIANTCLKLDPYNGQVIDLVKRLSDFKSQRGEAPGRPQESTAQLEKQVQENPQDFQAAFNLASGYIESQQTDKAMVVLDKVMNNPKADAAVMRGLVQAYASIRQTNGLETVTAKLEGMWKAQPTNFAAGAGLAQAYRELNKPAQATQTLDAMVNSSKATASGLLMAAEEYASMRDYGRLEACLEKLVKVVPESPEGWYDLAALKSTLGKTGDALAPLKKAIELSNKRHSRDPKARNLMAEAQKDPRFTPLRTNAEFVKLTAG
jgi:tetratricopeptide (TPR) repeat protein